MLYTYVCYWNRFQYKNIIQITFHVVKQYHTWPTSKDIYLLIIKLFLCLFLFCLNFILFHDAHLLLRCLTDLVCSILKYIYSDLVYLKIQKSNDSKVVLFRWLRAMLLSLRNEEKSGQLLSDLHILQEHG